MMKRPFPGSDNAVLHGCKCPRGDNARGRGAWGTLGLPDEEKVFVVNQSCPLHGKPLTSPDDGITVQ